MSIESSLQNSTAFSLYIFFSRVMNVIAESHGHQNYNNPRQTLKCTVQVKQQCFPDWFCHFEARVQSQG